MVHMYPLLHVVTYMTRIDYNALFTPKACVVQWIDCRPSDLEADGSNHDDVTFFFLFIDKFIEYSQTFVDILTRLSLCVLCI